MTRIPIALSGPGWIGEQLLHAIHQHPGAVVAGVHGPDRAAAQAALRRLGLDQGLFRPDYAQMAADPRVAAVVLAGPNASHAPQALAALAAGKHVLSEKPNSTSPAEHAALVAAALAAPGLVTMTDYIFHFDGLMERLGALVQEGAFGRLLQVQCNYRSPVNVSGSRAWKLRRDQVGDAIGMAITHALFCLLRIVPAPPVEVFAFSHPGSSGRWEVPPVWNLLVRFADGCCGVVLGDIESANGYDAGIQLHGSQGSFHFDSLAGRERSVRYRCPATGGDWAWPLDPAGGAPWPAATTTPTSGDVIGRAVQACVGHFVDCIANRRPSPLGFAAIRQVQDLGFAAQESARCGRPVALPGNEPA
jgi:predicted dehydrogenase